jgi:hypothetical protein
MQAVTTLSILDALHAAGITVAPTDRGTLILNPADAVTGDLLHLVRKNKPALLDYLRAANDSHGADVSLPPSPSPGHDGKPLWTDPLAAPMTSGEVETVTARLLLFMRRGLASISGGTAGL